MCSRVFFDKPVQKLKVFFKATSKLSKPKSDFSDFNTVNSATIKKSFDNASLPRSKNVASDHKGPCGTNAYDRYINGYPSNRYREEQLETTQKTHVVVSSIQADIKGLLTLYAVKSSQKGYADTTIKTRLAVLKRLTRRGAYLNIPETVWKTINKQEWSTGTKKVTAETYIQFCKVVNIQLPSEYNFRKWFKASQKLPWIPLEKEVDQLIAGCNRKTAAFLQLLKETGVRCGEAWELTWADVDLEHGILTMNKPEKNGKARQFKISSKLTAMLNIFVKTSETIWNGKLDSFRISYMFQRNRTASKLQNARIRRITFHTLRHFYGTMLYHKTKDILLVKEKLGHRNINSTLTYTQLVSFEADEYHSATAQTTEQATQLVEHGFDFVCTTSENIMLFRKRK